MNASRRNSGLMLLDTITGMVILGMLLGVMATAMSQQRHAATTLETQLRLDRLAEGVLTDLQQGKAPTTPAWGTEIDPTYTITELSAPGPCDGWTWVQVTARHEARQTSVIGASPKASLSKNGGTP